MEHFLLVGSIVAGLLSLGCSITTAVEVAAGKTRFPADLSFWGAMIFHLATALLALWLLGLWLGY